MANSNTKRWSTCVHEAGHAVVATAVGCNVTSVEVDGDRAGVTRTSDTPKPGAAVKVTLAGLGAEKLFDTGLSTQELLDGAASDLMWVGAVVPAELMSTMVERTHKMLSELRNEVEHVACELYAHGCLSGDEVRAVMNEWAEA